MKVVNVHQRLLYASPARVGQLLNTLATPDDALWPRQHWPRMRLDADAAPGQPLPVKLVTDVQGLGPFEFGWPPKGAGAASDDMPWLP